MCMGTRLTACFFPLVGSSAEYGEGRLIFVITFNRLLPLSNAAL